MKIERNSQPADAKSGRQPEPRQPRSPWQKTVDHGRFESNLHHPANKK